MDPKRPLLTPRDTERIACETWDTRWFVEELRIHDRMNCALVTAFLADPPCRNGLGWEEMKFREYLLRFFWLFRKSCDVSNIYKYGRRNDIRKLREQSLALNVRIWLVDAHFDFKLATSLISYSVGCPFANMFATIRRELRRICHLFVTNLLMEVSSVFRRFDVNHVPG